MSQTSLEINELLVRVVERFQFHAGKIDSGNLFVAEIARKMCEVEIWEMWELTQTKGGIAWEH